MTQRRSIQDMVPPSRRPVARPKPPVSEDHTPPPPPRRPSVERSSSTGPRWPLIVAAALILLAVAGVALASTVFSGAVITITPKQKTVQISTTITAAKIPTADQVPFEVVTAEDSATQKVPATGEQNVQERASGTIVVYNAYSTQSQRLIKNTRFETSDGLVYRIQNSIVVPGMKGTVPGSLEVMIYADEAGEKYNIGLSDFTLPGLKGSAQYSKMYARSKTVMQGGYVGVKKVVDPAAREAAVSALKNSLSTTGYEKLAANVPQGFILFDEARALSFETLPDQIEGNDVNIGVKAIAHGIILPVSKIAATLAAQSTADYHGEDITIANPLEITAAIVGSSTEPWNENELAFSISGTPHLLWVVDEARLTNDFLGKPKGDIETVLGGYASVDRAEASIYPVWSSTFPKEAERITIKQVVNQ